MGKSTLVLILLAALVFGTLIGLSLVDGDASEPVANQSDVAIVADENGSPIFRYLAPGNITVEYDDFGQPLPWASGENFIARDGAPKSETLTIILEPDATVEYKALMSQGDALTFRWETDGGIAYYDFHGHDESFGPEFYTRYDEGEGTGRAGSIIAPYSGQHGWFWLNTEGEPMTITLDVAGFYDDVVEIDLEAGY